MIASATRSAIGENIGGLASPLEDECRAVERLQRREVEMIEGIPDIAVATLR